MKKLILMIMARSIIIGLCGCSSARIPIWVNSIDVQNRDVVPSVNAKYMLELNKRKGDGLALIEGLEFKEGTIELELKGENKPQGSFLGVAFNIQNDSTYEAIYFRPFNFQSDEKTRREHSVQYIFKPEFEWRVLRTGYPGQYESEYPRQPSPEDWFVVKIRVDNETVSVIDKKTKTVLLSIKRLTSQVSNRIGLWVGYDSKGKFRNLKIKK